MVKNSLRRLFHWSACWCLGICLVLFLSQVVLAQGYNFPRSLQATSNPSLSANLVASPAPQVPRAFFPLVFLTREGSGIFGFVTQHGLPAKNVFLYLRKIDGNTLSVAGTTSTDANGYYQFLDAGSLTAGQYYQVVYDGYNPLEVTPGRLAWWKTKLISSYSSGQKVNIGNFDIADIALIAPVKGDPMPLPVTFQWIRRTLTINDSYHLKIELYVPASVPPAPPTPAMYIEKYTSSSLGYVSSFSFLPADWQSSMEYGVAYTWFVVVEAPDSASGANHDLQRITFKK